MSNKKNRLKESAAMPDSAAPPATPVRTLVLPELEQGGPAEAIPQAKTNGAAGPTVTDVQANCGNCLAFVTKDGVSGECRGGPPTAQLLGFAEHPITRQPVPRVQGYFPPTHKDIWCASWTGARQFVDGHMLVPFIAYKEVPQ